MRQILRRNSTLDNDWLLNLNLNDLNYSIRNFWQEIKEKSNLKNYGITVINWCVDESCIKNIFFKPHIEIKTITLLVYYLLMHWRCDIFENFGAISSVQGINHDSLQCRKNYKDYPGNGCKYHVGFGDPVQRLIRLENRGVRRRIGAQFCHCKLRNYISNHIGFFIYSPWLKTFCTSLTNSFNFAMFR